MSAPEAGPRKPRQPRQTAGRAPSQSPSSTPSSVRTPTPTPTPTRAPAHRLSARNVDEIIDLWAAAQHGVVARWQLLADGVTEHAIEHRIRSGRLRPIHRGVYGVGRLRGPHAAEMAAVVAGGRGALLSYRSAAALWKQLPAGPADAPVEVSTPGRNVLTRPGLRIHRTGPIPADEATSLHGIPITTPARTLLDLAMVLSAHDLERALARALRGGVEEGQILTLLARYPKRPGARLLRSLLDAENLVFTRSHAEEAFLAIVQRGGLPKPETNVRVRGFEVDFFFRAARLIIEVDGATYHSAPAAVERDHNRDQALFLAGYTVLRFIWKEVDQRPDRVLAKVAGALAIAEARRG
jgi:very-short-patch-repair endonuclease